MMQLSPLTHYYVQRLLRQYTELWNCLLVGEVEERSRLQADLNDWLGRLYPQEAKQRIQELETLIQIYRRLEKQPTRRETLTEIQRRIYQLLGLKLASMLPERLPTILPERSLYRFCFYHAEIRYQECVREGARHDHEMYGLVWQFKVAQRLRAFQMAWVLIEHNIPLILTVSESRYALWVRLQSPTYRVLVEQDGLALNTMLTLQGRFYKVRSRPLNYQTA